MPHGTTRVARGGPAARGARRQPSAAMDRQTGRRLRDRHHLDRIDVDVRGARRDPVDGVGNILGRERLDVLIDVRCFRVVAAVAHVRELRAAAEAGLDVGDAQRRADEVGAQIQAELSDESLGCAVYVSAGIRVGAGDRTEVEDVAAAARDHPGQQRVRDRHETGAVRVDHRVPFVEAGVLGRLDTEREAGVVDQHVERREFGGKGGRHRFDGGAVAHVEFEWQQRVAQFRGERIEPILAARGGDDAVAALDEGTGDGCAEAGGRACDEHDHCCCSWSMTKWPIVSRKPTEIAAPRQGAEARGPGARNPALIDSAGEARLPIHDASNKLTRSSPLRDWR
ncbi:hypothetical protein BVIET440_90228 [Burkholderia vietnamiensis]